MIKPKRIGKFFDLDKDGHIIPDVSLEKIQPRWRDLVTYVSDKLISFDKIKSVYIRGSIPRGLAQEGYSDVDFLCLTEENLNKIKEEINQYCKNNFPFARGIEIGCFNESVLSRIKPNRTRPYAHMLLKTQSLFLLGENICDKIEPFHPDIEVISHAFNLTKDLAQYNEWKTTEPQLEDEGRKWLARRVVRSGLEVTLDRSQQFTRDLYLCYEKFAEFYPEKEQEMCSVLNNALNAELDMGEFKELIYFLNSESKRMLK